MVILKNKRGNLFGIMAVICLLGIPALPAGAAAANGDIWQNAIRAYLSKNYPQSISLLNQYLATETDRDRQLSAKFFLAENFRLSGAKDRALPLYQSLSSAAPKGPLKVSARFREAETAYNRGDYSRAADGFNDLAHDGQADFLFPQIRLALVKSNLKLKRINEAQQIFSDLLAAYPRALLDPDIKFLFGIMKEYQGQTFDALKIYEELGEDPLAQLFAGAILEAQGRFLPAIDAYHQAQLKARQTSHKQMAGYFKIRAFYKSGDYLAAGKLVDTYLEKNPQSFFAPKAALLRILVWLAQARFEEVLTGYAGLQPLLVRLSENDRALLQGVLAEAALNLNRFPEAAQSYANALAFSSEYRSEWLLKSAYVHAAMSNWEKAAKSLNDYFDDNEHPEELSQVLAVRVYLRIGREALAYRALNSLAESKSPLADLGFYLMAEFYMNRQDTAILVGQWALLEKKMAGREPALEYRETAAWARLFLAEAYYRLGNYTAAREQYHKALEYFPRGKVEIYVWAGLVWCGFQMQDYQTVLTQSEHVLKAKDTPAYLRNEIVLLQAHAFFNRQMYAEAIQGYRHWLAAAGNQPEAPTVHFQVAWSQYLNKSYLDAVETWKDLAKKYPQTSEAAQALTWVGDTYFQGGENAQARATYEELLRRFPQAKESKAYELRVAQTYYNEQKDEEAIPRFLKLLQTYPDSDEAKEAQKAVEGASYRIADRLDSIPAFHEFILKFPESTLSEDIQYRIGEAYYQKEKYNDSLHEFLQFVMTYTKSPRSANAQYYLAVCQEQVGNSLNAAQQAEAFLKNYPQHELAPEMMFRLASAEFQLERYLPAAEHFVACAEKYSLKEYQPRAWYNAAVIYDKLQVPSKAVEYYTKLIQAYPQDPNAATTLARLALMQAAEKNASGVETVLQKMEANPDPELLLKTYLSLSVLYQEQGEDAAREAVFKRLMDKGSPKLQEYSLALVELASLYEQKKAWSSALTVYQRLLKVTLQPKWRDAAKKRIKLLQRILQNRPKE
ncbi:MAG: tetratricopeptide repeat protein [Candidatus Firestonebacteria bacterium]|nr:tetratricopeptide repeat protein [Candidatus Firestonebacteria bacterium]